MCSASACASAVKGLMNVQFAIKDDVVYVLEVNPRASRTTPFVSKATGVPLAKIAARIAAGQTLAGNRLHQGAEAGWLLRQGSGAAVQQVPRRVLSAWAGDAQHRRSDGTCLDLWPRVCKGRDGRRRFTAHQRQCADHGERLRQGRCHAHCEGTAPTWLFDLRNRRHRRMVEQAAHSGDAGEQGERRLAACRRPDHAWAGADVDQHPAWPAPLLRTARPFAMPL